MLALLVETLLTELRIVVLLVFCSFEQRKMNRVDSVAV